MTKNSSMQLRVLNYLKLSPIINKSSVLMWDFYELKNRFLNILLNTIQSKVKQIVIQEMIITQRTSLSKLSNYYLYQNYQKEIANAAKRCENLETLELECSFDILEDPFMVNIVND